MDGLMYRHPYHFAIRLLICQGPSRFFQQVQLETISENLAQVFDRLLAKNQTLLFSIRKRVKMEVRRISPSILCESKISLFSEKYIDRNSCAVNYEPSTISIHVQHQQQVEKEEEELLKRTITQNQFRYHQRTRHLQYSMCYSSEALIQRAERLLSKLNPKYIQDPSSCSRRK
ncbi:unnamed protein product [Albugo candida]|uniref:Uncharacterized protein n=1 Tax=Albugo candida TaxID=65357 RepID=A0A024FTR9_9STRA|nr:unnamed protein product [Albugo candida]|eukprot:CCI10054.1 unnamed protein product [Albugo candida]